MKYITKKITSRKGSFLLEALLAMVIFTGALVALSHASSITLRVLAKFQKVNQALIASEKIVYDLEVEKRYDLIRYGGKGKVGPLTYEIESEEQNNANSYLREVTIRFKDSEKNEIALRPKLYKRL